MIIWMLFIVTSLGQVQVVDNIANEAACTRLGDNTVRVLAQTPAGASQYVCQAVVKLAPL